MPNRAFTISFVSGKGGVGKTSLATNLAWVMAKFGKVGFVDLDLQNQGATGLFSAVYPLQGCGVLGDLLNLSTCGKDDAITVGPDLLFFPAVAPNSQISYSGIAELINSGEIESRVAQFLDRLQLQFGFDVVILDCHGGLDFLSLSAHRNSDRTVVVTEADTVTFNGTLELLEFYRSHGGCADDGQPAAAMCVSRPERKLEFVVNRVAAKYRYDDLNGMYLRLLGRHDFGPAISSDILAYIPAEDFFSDSYGEYPFAVSLAPKSVMFRKLNLLAFKLLPEQLLNSKLVRNPTPFQMSIAVISPFGAGNDHQFFPFYALRRSPYRDRVERNMVGRGMRNTQRIIISFALLCTLISFWLVIVLLGVLGNLAFPDFMKLVSNKFVLSVLALLSGLVLLYTMFTSTGLTAFYADKYQFQRRLWRALGKPLTGWQRLALSKLLILRVGTLVGPILFLIITAYGVAVTLYLIAG